MKRNEYTALNERAWTEVAPIHAAHNAERLLKEVTQPVYSCLDDVMTSVVNGFFLEDGPKSVAHLCCNNGRELLSIRNMGAGRCVGFDISDEFIILARELNKAAGLDCEFFCTDVYDIPTEFDGQFDLVYVTVGALGWMPDIQEFFRVVNRLLKPEGRFFAYEMHPVLDMFNPGEGLVLKNSYFKTDPFIDTDGLDYYGGTEYEAEPAYWFHHTISDIITACLNTGMTLEHFREYGRDLSNGFAPLEQEEALPPLSYSLVARKR